MLESFNIGARLQRGRSYARNGQVLSIDVERGQGHGEGAGVAAAAVRGRASRSRRCRQADWEQGGCEALAGQALFAAKLLAGEMPQDIEEVFKEAGAVAVPAEAAAT